MPRRYQGRQGSIGGDDLGENGGPSMTPKSRGPREVIRQNIEFEVVRQIQSFSPISSSGIEPTHSRHVYGPLRDCISLVLGTHAYFGRLLYCDRMVRSACYRQLSEVPGLMVTTHGIRLAVQAKVLRHSGGV